MFGNPSLVRYDSPNFPKAGAKSAGRESRRIKNVYASAEIPPAVLNSFSSGALS